MERHYPQKFYSQHALRSEISSKDTSPPPTKQNKKKKPVKKELCRVLDYLNPVVPFITPYQLAVPNLKEILTMICYLITFYKILKEPLITSYRKAHSLQDILVRAKI